MDDQAGKRPHSCRWWKVGFFVALLAFEVAREMYVFADNGPPNFAIGTAVTTRSADGSLVGADGRWERTDGGDPLVPSVVSIQCERDIGSCIMASSAAHDSYIFVPQIDRRPATFTSTGAEFTDDWPICDKLFVRIDAVHNLTTAVRSTKGSKDPMCKGHDANIQMRLGGFQEREWRDWDRQHFVPIFALLRAVANLFD